MIFDIDMIRKVYDSLPEKIKQAKDVLQRPLTLTEKILFAHLWQGCGLFTADFFQAEDGIRDVAM